MTSSMKLSICILLKCSTCIKIIVLKIMNCTTQFFMIFSIWSRIIEIYAHRLFEISSTRFVIVKNIEFFIRIVRKLKLNWCIDLSKNHLIKIEHRIKSLMWKEIIVNCFRLFEIEKTNLKKRISTRTTSRINRIRIDQILCYVNSRICINISLYICFYIHFHICLCMNFFICFCNIFISCWIIKRSINSTIECSTNLAIIYELFFDNLWKSSISSKINEFSTYS
jgi:hypothetical protein